MEIAQIFSSINKLLTTHFNREFWLSLEDELTTSYANANASIDSPLAKLEQPQKKSDYYRKRGIII